MAFDKKYSDEQRDAFWRAWREDDLSTTTISRLARQGELYDFKAFNAPERTVRDIVSRRLMAEARQGVGESGGVTLNIIIGRLITVADSEASRLLTLQGKGELDAKDFREFVRSIGDLLTLQKQAVLRGKHSENGDGGDDEPTGLAGRLVADAANPEPPPAPDEPASEEPAN